MSIADYNISFKFTIFNYKILNKKMAPASRTLLRCRRKPSNNPGLLGWKIRRVLRDWVWKNFYKNPWWWPLIIAKTFLFFDHARWLLLRIEEYIRHNNQEFFVPSENLLPAVERAPRLPEKAERPKLLFWVAHRFVVFVVFSRYYPFRSVRSPTNIITHSNYRYSYYS